MTSEDTIIGDPLSHDRATRHPTSRGARTSKATKMTLPSPTMYAYYWVPGVSDAADSSTDAYLSDVTDTLKD